MIETHFAEEIEKIAMNVKAPSIAPRAPTLAVRQPRAMQRGTASTAQALAPEKRYTSAPSPFRSPSLTGRPPTPAS